LPKVSLTFESALDIHVTAYLSLNFPVFFERGQVFREDRSEFSQRIPFDPPCRGTDIKKIARITIP